MSKKTMLLSLLSFIRIYSLAALGGLFICRIIYGHAYESSLLVFLAWSCFVASFLWLFGAAIQAFNGSRQIACINAVLAITVIYLAAHLMPYLAK